ncbi:MAG: hypothetical protein M0R38_11955 [Bacteroidia bacterium]|nr:hypothetical protein [Bacteroidia bacterium]
MNYLKINGKWLSSYKTIIDERGKKYFIHLETTEDFGNTKGAVAIPDEDIIRVTLSARKLLEQQGETVFVYAIDNLELEEPAEAPTEEKVSLAPVKKEKHDPTVELDIDSLQKFMLSRGVSNVHLAQLFGFDGERIYYGSKIVVGKLKPRYSQIVRAAKKYDYFKRYL